MRVRRLISALAPLGALLLVALCGLLPERAPTSAEASAWHYVAQGIVACALFALGASRARRATTAAVLWWGAFEELQIAACGIGSYGVAVPAGGRLCIERYGAAPYELACSAAFATMGVLACSPRASRQIRGWLLRLASRWAARLRSATTQRSPLRPW